MKIIKSRYLPTFYNFFRNINYKKWVKQKYLKILRAHRHSARTKPLHAIVLHLHTFCLSSETKDLLHSQKFKFWNKNFLDLLGLKGSVTERLYDLLCHYSSDGLTLSTLRPKGGLGYFWRLIIHTIKGRQFLL